MYDFVDTIENPVGVYLPSEALNFNGEYLENLIPGYRTLYVSGREEIEAELYSGETGTADGSWYQRKRYPARVITVGYQLIAADNSAFREAYNKLNAVLDAEEATLIFNDEPDKFFTGTRQGSGNVPPGRNAVTGELEFFCADPFKYSVTEYEVAPSIDDGSTILVDYRGTYRAYPVLEADFYKEDEASEDGETVEALTGKGDCGYVAFFNEDEKIIQLGDPDEAGSVEMYEKSQTLVSHVFDTSGAWNTASQSLLNMNDGAVAAGSLQTGALGMHVASYTTPSAPKATSGTLLNRRKTTGGNPLFYYTVTARAYDRTANSVKVQVTVTSALALNSNYFGRGFSLQGALYIGGAWRYINLKHTSEYWRGQSGHTVSAAFTVTGLSAGTNVLTGIRFSVARTDSVGGASGILGEVSCSSLPVSIYETVQPASYILSPSYGEGNGYHGPSVTRVIPSDASGEVGAVNCTLTWKQMMCIGNGSKDTGQTGAFQALLVSGTGSNRKIVAGIRILKNMAGKNASLIFFMNGEAVQTVDIDLSYANPYFGAGGDAVQTSTIVKSGASVSFNIGGIQRTFTDETLAGVMVHQVTFMFEQYGTSSALSFNGISLVKFIKNNCNAYKDIPNKFSTNDVLEADCKDGEIYLNGASAPDLGAVGNDWEDFCLKPGINQIGVAYSEWVSSLYAPTFKLRYREVFL